MRTHESGRQAWVAATCAIALLTLPIATALAAVPSTTAHHFSSHPMISGTVVTVNDHQMVVDTDQGEQVTLEVDSRTLAPRDLAPGMVMRAEFLALEDCRFYAQRIMPIRGGMSTSRLQAYANSLHGHESMAHAAPAQGVDHGHPVGMQAGAMRSAPMPMATDAPSPGRMMSATPITADHQFSSRPMLSGSVLAVNDHWLLVGTDQGQRVGLVMDSRTMVPREVAPGSVMRAEFTQLKDGRYYARRISRIGSGVVDREQAYANTRDSDLLMASNPSDCGFASAGSGTTVTSAVESRTAPVMHDLVAAQEQPAAVVERPQTLPQTASNDPLFLLLGLFTFASAGFVWFAGILRSVVHGLRTAANGLRIV